MPRLGIIIFGCLTKPNYRQQIEDCYATWVRDAIEAGCIVRFYVGDIPSDINNSLKALCIDLQQGDEYISAMFKQWKGLDHMISTESLCDFYFTCGTDTFLNIPNTLERLNEINANEALYIGGGECGESVDGTHYKYFSGGGGIFLTYTALQHVMERIPDFIPWWMAVGLEMIPVVINGVPIMKDILGACDLQLGIVCQRANISKVSLGSAVIVGDGTHNREGVNKDELISCHLMQHDDFYDYWKYIHRKN